MGEDKTIGGIMGYNPNPYSFSPDEECTSVIVTGSCCEGGRTIHRRTRWQNRGIHRENYRGKKDVYINGIMNFPPEKPLRLSITLSGKVGIEYNYSTITTDYDEDAIYFMFDWGDNTTSEWIGPYVSGETATISHIWTKEGNYSIRVKAKDEKGAERGYSNH